MVILRYTGNVGHQWQTSALIEKVVADIEGTTFILGHSQGAHAAMQSAAQLSLPFIQWAGTCNSRGEFPYASTYSSAMEAPQLLLLGEKDARLPVSCAVKDALDLQGSRRQLLVTLPDETHSSALQAPHTVAKVSAAFIAGTVLQKNATATAEVEDLRSRSASRFKALLHEASAPRVRDWTEAQQLEYSGSPVTGHHHSSPPHILLALLSYVCPPLQWYVNLCMLLPAFATSRPSPEVVHSYTPLKSPLCSFSRKIVEPSNSVKLWDAGARRVSAKSLNQRTFYAALSSLPKEDVKRYLAGRKRMYFEDDIVIAPLAGCGLRWLCSSVQFKYGEEGVRVASPTLTALGGCNAKLLSTAQALEWILCKSEL